MTAVKLKARSAQVEGSGTTVSWPMSSLNVQVREVESIPDQIPRDPGFVNVSPARLLVTPARFKSPAPNSDPLNKVHDPEVAETPSRSRARVPEKLYEAFCAVIKPEDVLAIPNPICELAMLPVELRIRVPAETVVAPV